MSDSGSEAGAAICSQVRSDAVNVALFNTVTWTYTACQRPCTGGGGVRDEEAGSSNLPTPTNQYAGHLVSGGLRFSFTSAHVRFWARVAASTGQLPAKTGLG